MTTCATLASRKQSAVNDALGASLSTVIRAADHRSVGAVIVASRFQMMTPAQLTVVLITITVAVINLNEGETYAIEGRPSSCCSPPSLCLR